jgi:hypothetical protein
MSLIKKADKVLSAAKVLAKRATNWADLSLELFDQHSGLVAETFPDEMERQAFFQTEQYKAVNELLLGLMRSTGLMEGGSPGQDKSGRFNIRIPKSLHKALEVEAQRESVSLNHLATTKLAIPLRHLTDEHLVALVRAFADVHEGYSSDRIVADPDYNAKFLRRCREIGLTDSDVSLNHALYGIRKSKKQRDRMGIVLPPTTKDTEFDDFDGYQYAAEIAVRVLQRTRGVSLDRIICDPDLAAQFDKIALGLVNETVLKLRWSALNLRKTRRLQPIPADATSYDLVSVGPVRSINLDAMADLPGLYVFYDVDRPVYAGETDRLRERISKHLQYGIPCVDVKHDTSLQLKTFSVPRLKQSERLKWLVGFINRERPLLNYQRAA